MTDLAYDGTQETYHAIRCRQAEEVARIVSTATPWPKRASGMYGWRIRPEPGTVDDHELTEL
jgi:hypothetical protein